MYFSSLNTTWFALIGLLWAGYMFLDGFDFGVCIVAPFVARDDIERRLCLNAIGPVWDGNEVWLLTAGGATFAAFPLWYARLFSGFYIALFLVLLALIARAVSFEFRAKHSSQAWQDFWGWANFAGSLIPAIVWGAAFVDLVHGVPLTSGGVYKGGLIGLLHPVALVGGLSSLALFSLHGAAFLSLKTAGELSSRARQAAVYIGVAATALLVATVAWVAVAGRPDVPGAVSAGLPLVLAVVAIVAVAAATVLLAYRREGWAFAATGAAILMAMGAIFARMFPDVLPASNRAAYSITIQGSASQHNTLVVMTVVAAIFTPFVLLYQGWTYWVFRQRLSRPGTGEVPPRAAAGSG
ncbi:MAG TPA: cytochrome d ubiquinol oxidase subunit II [Acidimicrobiales bacterium]|nr:cytochrome d ubiquinol oxidase subunit II [Acidimicrobiales bacterium]